MIQKTKTNLKTVLNKKIIWMRKKALVKLLKDTFRMKKL